MGGESLPYDAEIEYLESSGTQLIDTRITHKEQQKYELDIIATPTTSESDFIGSFDFSEGALILGFYGLFIFGYNKGNERIDTPTLPIIEAPFNIKYEFLENKRRLIINGTIYEKSGASYNYEIVHLFGGGKKYCLGKMKCKKFIIKDINNKIILNMLPVRVGNIGYMYDKVSGQLFGNSGTGDFILGPDK